MANRHEDDDEFLDVEAASYQPLTAVDPELDRRLRHTYVSLFLSESELSERRYGQAYEMLSISRGILPDGRRLLRVDFPFMGSILPGMGWNGRRGACLHPRGGSSEGV